MATIEVRELHTPKELAEVVQLQFEIWGSNDATPANQLVISVKTGGHVLGAFDGGRLVSFAYGFPALLQGQEPWIASHMLATRPEYAGQGIGRMLKWRQRDWALARGYRRITWTFDPLEGRNAHLNLNLLGAVAREYIVDCYGPMEDKLNQGLPSDRLMADWQLDSERVQAALRGERPAVAGEQVQVPALYQRLRQEDPQAALAERLRVRRELQALLGRGLSCVAFDRDRSAIVLR